MVRVVPPPPCQLAEKGLLSFEKVLANDEREWTLESGRDEAVELLASAEAASRAVQARAAWDYRVYFAWAVWLLVFLPPLDFVNGALWSVVVTVTSALGTLLTVLYFCTRSRQVHLGRASRMRRWILFWLAWTPWYVAWVIGANSLQGHVGYAWTLAGIAGALPCLVAGFVSWRSR
jgi:hypothetical protein